MTPAQVYKCLELLPEIHHTFGGVIPTSALKIIPHLKSTKLKYFIILTNELNCNEGHYGVLMCHNRQFELFNPLGGMLGFNDIHLLDFIISTRCKLNLHACQPIYSPHCSIYCLLYIYLRTQHCSKRQSISLLKSLNLP
jgi:hypothetical protein